MNLALLYVAVPQAVNQTAPFKLSKVPPILGRLYESLIVREFNFLKSIPN